MGMAAGQARFLALTARKTNVEFEGQQINQQRTVLANQSSAFNNQLLGMKVPTPPSSADYTSTSYTWTDNSNTTYTLNSIVPDSDDDTGTRYKIKYTYTDSNIDGAYINESDKADKITRSVVSGAGTTDDPYVYSYSINGAALTPVTNEDDLDTLRAASSNTDAGEQFYCYKDSDNKESYYSALDLADDTINWAENKASITKYQIGTHSETVQVGYDTPTYAVITKTEEGRMKNIKINGSNYSIDTNTVKDDAAYEDAMNQYNYDQAQYEKALSNINAKLDIVQQQDKNLELKLKAVDTEQQAISTEMEAVSKVIDKNIEATFKTFG